MQGTGNNSPTKRTTLNNLNNFGQIKTTGLQSPTKESFGDARSLNNQNKKVQTNWSDFIRKEQEKLIKQLKYQQRHQNDVNQNSNNNNHQSKDHQHQEEEDINDNTEMKHPYIQACYDKDIFTKKHLIKTSQIPPSSLKDYTHKEKNLITDLPDQSNSILFNGIEFSLKKAFGQYQQPINKSIHFISSQTVIFFVGNYIAMHNVARDETRYIGIDQNLQLVTAFEVQPVDQSQKLEKLSFSPSKQTINQESPQNTNQSPHQKHSTVLMQSQLHNSETILKEAKTSIYSQQPSGQLNTNLLNLQNTNTLTLSSNANQQPTTTSSNVSQHQRDLQTLIAFAEKAKETHLKEQKFQSKKVYAIQNNKNKRGSKIVTQSTTSPTNIMRQSQNNNFGVNISPSRHSPTKNINSSNNLLALQQFSNSLNANNDSPTLFNLEEVQNVKYLVKVNVFTLGNPHKKYVLQHFFDEYFYVQQISLRDKESLCYTLCTNKDGEQIFFIWNFRKEIVLGYVEMKSKINKFVVTPNKCELILFLGKSYLKYYEANFTNKIIKENSLNIIPMKIEKESNFVDVEYINPRLNGVQGQGPNLGDMFVLITDNTNSIFVFEKNQLKYKLFDQFKQRQEQPIQQVDNELNKTHDSVMSDSLEIGELSDREDIGRGEDHLRVKSIGTNQVPQSRLQSANNQAPGATTRNTSKNKNGFGAGLNMHSFQQQMKAASSSNRQEEHDHGSKADLLKSPLSGQLKNSETNERQNLNDPNDKETFIFQKISVTQKGFIIGCSEGYIVCYEFKNDFEPKMVNKVHVSNKIKAVASMSLSKGLVQNDDYMIAISGVYQKELKKAFRRQGENEGIRSISRRNSINRNNDTNYHSSQNNRDFFMPPIIKQQNQKKQRKGFDRSLDNRKRLSQLNNINFGTSQSNFKNKDDGTVQNLFGPRDLVEKQEFIIVNMKAIQTQQSNKIVEKIFAKGSHDGSIFQIASCRNKSSFYTISESNNLKVWNHTNEWRGASNYVLDEQPLCIDIHPSSWQIALGFKSGIKIYQSLGKEIKLSFEKLGKAALSLAYSDGGHMLACSNAVYIDIIDPIRMQLLVTLFGHKGLVRNLSWTLNSKYLISTCSNGGLFFWKGNFKEQNQKLNTLPTNPDEIGGNQSQNIQPIGMLNDKNYLYNQLAYDDDLDVVIALTSTSTLRLIINHGQEPLHEEDLITMNSLQTDTLMNYAFGIKATSMTFSKTLGIIVIGYSNGKVSVVSWPIIPNLRTFKYDILLQQNPITDVRFSYASRYLIASTDDGNLYVLDTFRTTEGLERTWMYENQDKLTLQKKRETYGMTGYSATDNLIMSNKEVLKNVNKKIDKLKMMKKSQEVNHEIKKRKTEKRYEKQMKLIGKELQEELDKQGKLMTVTDQQFIQEKSHLKEILEDQTREHFDEREVLVQGKEKNLNFVSNENDELETRILRLKETIVDELERIEEEHQQAVNELVQTYEHSIKTAQDEVKNTIEKLKQNGSYYENMIKLQEKDYEQEVQKLQTDLIEDHTEFVKRKDKLENDDNQLKDEYQTLEGLYKEKNNQRKEKLLQVQDLTNDYKAMYSNLERLGEKNIQSNIFIDEKERSAHETVNEKKQLENVIAFLSEKIKELKNERMPLEDRKKELEKMIQDTYRELQDDFQFRKYLELKQESLDKKMDMIKKEIHEKEDLKESIEQKKYIFKRELSYLAEAQSLKGWTHKMQGMLKCMSEVYYASTAEQAKNISTAFIHIAEIMESNARPYRPSQHEDDQFTKQSKLNEMELAYYRNKNSQKMEEMQLRFKALFGQMEKAVKKLRNDNIKLIEEFNTLINEKKKLNNLRKMIKESLKEFLGDKYQEDKHGSSDDDGYKVGGKKKQKRQQSQDTQRNLDQNNQDQIDSSRGKQSQQMGMSRSKSTQSFAMKHAKILQNVNSKTQRDYLMGSQIGDDRGHQTDRGTETGGLPDLKAAQPIKMSQISFGGSMTSRDPQDGSNFIKKNGISGFNLNKSQQLMNKRRFINNLASQQSSTISNPQQLSHASDFGVNHGQKYLEKIVDEFEKNKRQLEEQTRALQKIQNLAQVLTETQSPQLQIQQQNMQPTSLMQNQSISQTMKKSQSTNRIQQIGAAPAVPSLNLRKMMLKNEQYGLGSQTSRQTITTRVPVSTERTQSIISMFHQQTGLGSLQSSSRQLPTVKEKSSLYSSKESSNNPNNMNVFSSGSDHNH